MFRLAFRAVPKVGMIDTPEVNAIAAVNGAEARYRLVGCPVPASGAAQDLAREPQNSYQPGRSLIPSRWRGTANPNQQRCAEAA